MEDVRLAPPPPSLGAATIGFGAGWNRSRPVQWGTSDAGGGIESPAGRAGGAQFDIYDSMSENTRAGKDVKEVRGAQLPHPAGSGIAPTHAAAISYLTY